MNKKTIRIFIAVCLMLAMTSSTAFAKASHSHFFHCYVTSQDRVEKRSGQNPKCRISGHVVVSYSNEYSQYEVDLHDINFERMNGDTSTYDYVTEYYDDDDHNRLYVYIVKDGKDVGYLYYRVTSNGRLKRSYHH